MAVRGEYERHVQSLGVGIQLRLLEPVVRRQALSLRLDERDGHGLRLERYFDAQDVIDLPPAAPPRSAIDDLDGTRGLLAANQVFRPAAGVDGRIDQLRAGV
jgi:hypothetical protein